MLKLTTKQELDALHAGLIKESLTLEYKSSGAVDKSQQKKEEIAKDALAFANAAGGQIVYGMEENNNLPQGLDDGIDPSQFPGIWFESVIQQNVSPQIEGLHIAEVPLNDCASRVAVVVTIPAGQSRVPHQARDGRYYRRHNFRNQIMEDYEVRDMMRRETTAKPYVAFAFANGSKQSGYDGQTPEGLFEIRLFASLSNRSRQPAFYTVVTIFISTVVRLISQGSFDERTPFTDDRGDDYNALRKQYGIPAQFPIFYEAQVPVSRPPITIGIDHTTHRDGSFPIGYEVLTPGYHGREFGLIRCNYGRLTIDFSANNSQ
jgi:hypothetical protein